MVFARFRELLPAEAINKSMTSIQRSSRQELLAQNAPMRRLRFEVECNRRLTAELPGRGPVIAALVGQNLHVSADATMREVEDVINVCLWDYGFAASPPKQTDI